jgi:hypothetical protein
VYAKPSQIREGLARTHAHTRPERKGGAYVQGISDSPDVVHHLLCPCPSNVPYFRMTLWHASAASESSGGCKHAYTGWTIMHMLFPNPGMADWCLQQVAAVASGLAEVHHLCSEDVTSPAGSCMDSCMHQDVCSCSTSISNSSSGLFAPKGAHRCRLVHVRHVVLTTGTL